MTTVAAFPDVSGWPGFLLIQLARAFRAFLVTLLLIAAIPLVSSWSGFVVRSGSMEPGMSVGDVIVSQPLDATEPIPVGRVMVFNNPDTASNHHTMIHRVVENLGGGSYATAGDANRDIDSTPVARENFTSRPTLSVPFIGLPLTWWAERNLGPLIFWLALASLALYFSARPPCDPRHSTRPEGSAGIRRASLFVVPVAVLVVAIVGAPLTNADAAFSATTRNQANTWTVSMGLSTAIVLNKPSSVVRGTVPVTATLNEPSGRAFSVRIEFAPAGTTEWQSMCTDSAAPFACSWVTTAAASGSYDLRAVATSGSTTYTSVVVRNIMVDNTAPLTSMQNPGSGLKGNVPLAATASDLHSGIATVVMQYAPDGTSMFTDACTATQTPYSCLVDTTVIPNGTYAFRSIATDLAGNTATSASVGGRTIANNAMRGSDVQTANGGATAGLMQSGDTMTVTFTQQAAPSSILSGWNGTATAVTVRIRDGLLLGLGPTDDTITVLRNGTTVNLGSINLRQSYISSLQTAEFAATMSTSTVTVGGVAATRVTLTIGAQTLGTTLSTVTTGSTMTWTPSASATNLVGRAAATTATSESGALDREF